MKNINGGIVAFVIGLVLASSTAVGVVQSQQSAGDKPVDLTKVNYGN